MVGSLAPTDSHIAVASAQLAAQTPSPPIAGQRSDGGSIQEVAATTAVLIRLVTIDAVIIFLISVSRLWGRFGRYAQAGAA